MGTDNNMREKLLKQMDSMREELLKQMNGGQAKTDKKSIEAILARDAARVRRMKWITVCVWVLVAVIFVIGGFLESSTLHKGDVSIGAIAVILRVLILIAVLSTVSFFLRSRDLQMKQIQQRLSEIEKVLRKLDKD